jgi:hypothetical protein
MLVFTWNGIGPIPGINQLSYVLKDQTGKVVATPAGSQVSYTLTPLPGKGIQTYSLVRVGTDANGSEVTSAPETVTISIP